MQFIHCADLHLDSPMLGLERYEGAPVEQMRETTRRAFENIVDLAIESKVAFILIAGDVFDGDQADFNSALYFANQLRRLNDADIPVFIVRGNHDALSRISKSVPYPANVHVFSADKPETQILESLGVAIHGQSFLTGAVHDNLAARYPDAVPGLLNIGLLHTAMTGREGHMPYAPASETDLLAKGYDYWALGHVHEREIIREDPWIVFPGNIQGRHAKETGAKGCIRVEVEDGRIQSVFFEATDVARWYTLELDISERDSMEAVCSVLQTAVSAALEHAESRPGAVRITLTGTTPLHRDIVSKPDQFRASVASWVNEASGGLVWLEKTKTRLHAPLDLRALAERDDPIGFLIRRLDALEANPEQLTEMAQNVLADVTNRMPADLKSTGIPLDMMAPDFLAEALLGARNRLLAELAEGEG